MIEIVEGIGGKNHDDVSNHKKYEVAKDEEVKRSSDLAVEKSCSEVEAGGHGGGLHYSSDQGEWRGDENGGEVG
jgi:hypothetical protein